MINDKQQFPETSLSEAEREQLLITWNNTWQVFPEHACIHQLFEEQAERTPDASALISDEQFLTYWELDQRANQLAHYLRALGVGPECLVGVCLDRSLELVITILAIFKAGGAYLPLDPKYPPARLTWMLEDSRASFVVTQRDWQDRLVTSRQHTHFIYLDIERSVIEQKPTERPLDLAQTENVAYVIYTSGSTGKPKGVAIAHHNIVAFLTWVLRTFSPQQYQGVLASTSICFDLSVFELWMPLCGGGTALLVDDVLQITTLPAAGAITLINTVPSAMIEILRMGIFPATAQTVCLAGEPLPAQIVQQLSALGTVEYVYNLYGPTEDTTYSTWELISQEPGRSISIGRPIDNSQAYVLNEQLQPVPIGEPGELYLGGEGLARGYINHPELTAERFVPHPFSEQPGMRLYRTGDIVRYRPDGKLEFIGRRDGQVKLRGYRIELGEIETVLREHGQVQDAVVLVREDRPGDKRLVAYVVSQSSLSNDLLRWLETKLPFYMVPSAVVLLERFPLTPNGKVDRKALPAPQEYHFEVDTIYAPPRTTLEEMLAAIWCQILGVSQIGIHNNFFRLGGHSLLATQVISRVRETLKVDLPLASIFESSTLAEFADRVEKFVTQKQDQLISTIQHLPHDGTAPLSFPQERIWFIQQLYPDCMAYQFQATLRLKGQLDVRAFKQSLNEIVRRHETMRTTFPVVNGQPIQKIHPPYDVDLPIVDLHVLPEDEREEAAQRIVEQEIRKPFDITVIPLIRWVVLRIHAQDHMLVHVEHHLLHDGWSFNLLLWELRELYQAYAAGKPATLPDLSIQFADFARWQRQWIQGEEAEAQLAYWKQRLADSPPTLQFPNSRPRPVIQRFRGRVFRIELPLHICEALRTLSRQENVTLFMTMVTVFIALLWRYSRQDDISIGTGIANRRWRETEGLIGMIINTLVLRAKMQNNPSFRDLLKQVREITLGAYAHQDLPLDKIVEALKPERNLSHNPLFQVMFSFHDSPLSDLTLPGLELDLVEALNNGSAKFDLNLTVIPRSEQHVGRTEGANGITMIWEYNTDLFDDGGIEQMIGHYQTLAEGIITNSEQSIGQCPIMSKDELEQVLFQLTSTWRTFPQDMCVHQLFEEQVERTPEAIAIVSGEMHLTYRELNRRANQLAHYLQRMGVGPDKAAGVYLRRSSQQIISQLAILKAGGAYVPLDQLYPPDRISFMLRDAQVIAVLTEQSLLDQLAIEDIPCICLDCLDEQQMLAQKPVTNPNSTVLSEHLVYTIYTSGSTGRPKGVQVSHRNLLNLINWHHHAYNFTTTDRTSYVAGLSFDAANFELWPALLAGSCLCLVDEESRFSPWRIQSWLREQALTCCFLPTPLAEQTLVLQWDDEYALRLVTVGGDRLHPLPVQQLPFAVVNNYGPAECTIVTVAGQVQPPAYVDQMPAIGRPIDNTQAYILDEQLQPVPIGLIGELYLGGEGLARGYINHPELTAEHFLPHPFSKQPGMRLYRTGDLARYLPDGELECMGRRDEQIKLRGYRIELGEIEVVLREHSQVQEAVVLLREDRPGDKRLVAYIVPEKSDIRTDELRRWVEAKLPDYMVPSAFLMLEYLPLNSNGKVDKQGLPVPQTSRADLEGSYVAPRTPLEVVLCSIWEEVLGIEKVGINDNFFALGGHSLISTQIIARVYDAFQVEIPLRSLFEMSTVAEQAMLMLQIPGRRAIIERTAQLLIALSELSEDEVDTLLDGKGR